MNKRIKCTFPTPCLPSNMTNILHENRNETVTQTVVFNYDLVFVTIIHFLKFNYVLLQIRYQINKKFSHCYLQLQQEIQWLWYWGKLETWIKQCISTLFFANEITKQSRDEEMENWKRCSVVHLHLLRLCFTQKVLQLINTFT